MSNKISLWIKEEAASVFETGQTVEEFLTQHFGSVEAAVAKGLRVALNDVEQVLDKAEAALEEMEAEGAAKAKGRKGKKDAKDTSEADE